MSFSEKIGKKQRKKVVQINSMDSSLVTFLWNTIDSNFFQCIQIYDNTSRHEVWTEIWCDFLGLVIDDMPHDYDKRRIYLREWYFSSEWFEKYDFIEFLNGGLMNDYLTDELNISCNKIFERELSGYRIISNRVVPITTESETQEITKLVDSLDRDDFVLKHMKTALQLLSNRQNPDYRNSIKESISSVEAFCNRIAGVQKSDFSKVIREVDKKFSIHPALKKAFLSLYGYTSDSGGIRHSFKTNDISPGIAEARFMLISCSAFINYLKAKEINYVVKSK